MGDKDNFKDVLQEFTPAMQSEFWEENWVGIFPGNSPEESTKNYS